MSGIQMALLGSVSNVVYRLDANSYSDIGDLNLLPAGTFVAINSDGTFQASTLGSGVVDSYDWLTPTAGSTTYYVRATLTAGSFSTGNAGVWEALTTNRVWSVELPDSPADFKSATATFAIATDSGGTNIVVSASISLEAMVN